mmetsp:Transcript_1609/g.2764  ORF Transcript_1609/g.2764 Transcript_1609/m.2764 type:complete len:216 (+) Transcript_1609:1554-2201(+)
MFAYRANNLTCVTHNSWCVYLFSHLPCSLTSSSNGGTPPTLKTSQCTGPLLLSLLNKKFNVRAASSRESSSPSSSPSNRTIGTIKAACSNAGLRWSSKLPSTPVHTVIKICKAILECFTCDKLGSKTSLLITSIISVRPSSLRNASHICGADSRDSSVDSIISCRDSYSEPSLYMLHICATNRRCTSIAFSVDIVKVQRPALSASLLRLSFFSCH